VQPPQALKSHVDAPGHVHVWGLQSVLALVHVQSVGRPLTVRQLTVPTTAGPITVGVPLSSPPPPQPAKRESDIKTARAQATSWPIPQVVIEIAPCQGVAGAVS
jgi:hypothetical protein